MVGSTSDKLYDSIVAMYIIYRIRYAPRDIPI